MRQHDPSYVYGHFNRGAPVLIGWSQRRACTPALESDRDRSPSRCRSPPRLETHRLVIEMATPQHQPERSESREHPVETVLQRAKPHPPYGEHIIDDLTDDEAEAFLDAALR